MANTPLTEREKMALWIRASWQNMLKYTIHNNPEEALDVLCDDCGIEDQEYSIEEIEAIATDAANTSGDPEAFTVNMASFVTHNHSQESWANLNNYSQEKTICAPGERCNGDSIGSGNGYQ